MKWHAAVTACCVMLAAVGAAAASPLALGRGGVSAVPNVCHDTPIATALVGKQPGELLAAPEDVTAASGLAPGAGRLYRMAYATTGEAGRVVASCGLVAVPAGSTSVSGVVAWAHGTVGLVEECQASERPATFVGPMPGGIGPATKKGTQESGALVGMLRRGYAVVATDYPSAGVGSNVLQYYALGVPEGLAVLDSARVLTGNAPAFGVAQVSPDARLPLVTWGHSQGGGSALWAGQLATRYFAAQGDHTLNLAGVAAEAPASQFTTSPGQPDAYMGRHLGDRDIYNNAPGLDVPIPIGTVLFSYVTVSWSQVGDGTGGAFPVGPTSSVDYRDVLSREGAVTAPQVARCCLNATGLKTIYDKTFAYLDPSVKRLFASPFAGQGRGFNWQGGIDATCATADRQAPAFREWCRWLQFNMPGPNGVNGYPKLPRNDTGHTVPMYLAQGRNDKIIWCVDSSGAVQGANCLTAQYVQSIRDSYCDGRDYLEVDYFPGVSHLGVPAAAATRPGGSGYTGSPLDTFVQGAMTGSLLPTCNIDADATSPETPAARTPGPPPVAG